MDDRQRTAILTYISERTPRPLAGPLLAFDLRREIDALRSEVEFDAGHNGRTLIKLGALRVVLVVLKAGANMQEHQGEQPLAFQPLTGQLTMRLHDRVLQLLPEQLVAVDRRSSFSIDAVEDSAFLIWVGWTES